MSARLYFSFSCYAREILFLIISPDYFQTVNIVCLLTITRVLANYHICVCRLSYVCLLKEAAKTTAFHSDIL